MADITIRWPSMTSFGPRGYTWPMVPVTSDEDWIVSVRMVDTDGAGFDLTSYTTIALEITNDYGTSLLTATLSNGDIATSADGDAVTSILTWTVRKSDINSIDPGRYWVAVRIGDGTSTYQIIRSRLPFREGGFTT